MLKRTWAALVVIALSGWAPSWLHAQQPAVPALQEKDKQQDERRPGEYLHYLHGAAHGLTSSGADEAPPRVAPETAIPGSEIRFNPSEFHPQFNPSEFHPQFNPAEFHPPTAAVSEIAPAVREAGGLFRGGEEGLVAGGGGLAAFFGAIGALFGRGKKGAKG